MKKSNLFAFTLVEVMIVVAIIGMLVAIAVPSYQIYTRRARFTEVVQAAAPYKIGVEECYQITSDLKNCAAGQNGIPAGLKNTNDKSLVAQVDVTPDGTITVTPKNKYGVNSSDTYVLAPTVNNDQLAWHTSGGAISAGYAN